MLSVVASLGAQGVAIEMSSLLWVSDTAGDRWWQELTA